MEIVFEPEVSWQKYHIFQEEQVQWSFTRAHAKGLSIRVTDIMVKLESHHPRGRNVTISIIDNDSKIW